MTNEKYASMIPATPLRGDPGAMIEQIRRIISDEKIHTVKIGGVDIDGIWRGKHLPVEYFLNSVWRDGTHICAILFGWDSHDELIPGLDFTGWQTGYPDLFVMPDLSTFRPVPWDPGTASVIANFTGTDGTPLELDPRRVLHNVVDLANRAGFTPQIGYEFEFYLFQDPHTDSEERNYSALRPILPGVHTYNLVRAATVESTIMRDIRRQMSDYGISVEASNTEAGPGQFEVSLRYCDAVAAADQALLYKAGVKELAAKRGMVASFMAKYHESMSGSSGHVHQSLALANGENAFYSGTSEDGLSDIGRWYLGGILATMHEFTALVCPTPNSYKRTIDKSWASTTPTWGIDNRTTGVRVINWTPAATRIEHRQPGADANPFLAIAAGLAAGLWGIENRVEPPSSIEGDAYEAPPSKVRPLPSSLEEAVRALDDGTFGREIFGSQFIDHFIATRRWELACQRRFVSDWERRRYLEII